MLTLRSKILSSNLEHFYGDWSDSHEHPLIFMLQLWIGIRQLTNYSLWVLIIVPFVLFVCLILLKLFIKTYRDLSRLKSVAASPVISHLGETLNGTSTIRAFRKEKDFIKKNNENLNIKLNIFFWKAAVRAWFGIRISLTALAIFIFTSSFWVRKFG